MLMCWDCGNGKKQLFNYLFFIRFIQILIIVYKVINLNSKEKEFMNLNNYKLIFKDV